MKAKPILFSTPMVRSILDGTKTQTRRPVKFKTDPLGPSGKFASVHPDGSGKGWVAWSPREVSAEETARLYPGEQGFKCPYGAVGDVLWVRETFNKVPIGPEPDEYSFEYRADGSGFVEKWTPSLHMPREACRLFLRITDIRVERLDEISEEDAVAEGLQKWPHKNDFSYRYEGGLKDGHGTHTGAFAHLWESINGKGSWGPTWVWVVNFERIDKPENF